ncbi:hypothetical protein MNB_SV-8-853 [hydrothermal vent metagenome]|uniref:Uncharacterized protein n=1 Tax=hydrothermal vent metagenome TaxID=652676 RepID=A0A1W1C0Z0_9ZZZZ
MITVLLINIKKLPCKSIFGIILRINQWSINEIRFTVFFTVFHTL